MNYYHIIPNTDGWKLVIKIPVDYWHTPIRYASTRLILIGLDDFGTGYSSLNYLKNFAITTLKIDRSFIYDINENPKNSAIVSSILAMGHNLMLNVTAEGVETKEQYETLRVRDCDIIQGYYFSKPLPQNEFEKLWLQL